MKCGFHAAGLRDTVLNALTTMMIAGNYRESERPFLEQMTHIADVRVIRAEALDRQYGKGPADDYAKDAAEQEVLRPGRSGSSSTATACGECTLYRNGRLHGQELPRQLSRGRRWHGPGRDQHLGPAVRPARQDPEDPDRLHLSGPAGRPHGRGGGRRHGPEEPPEALRAPIEAGRAEQRRPDRDDLGRIEGRDRPAVLGDAGHGPQPGGSGRERQEVVGQRGRGQRKPFAGARQVSEGAAEYAASIDEAASRWRR